MLSLRACPRTRNALYSEWEVVKCLTLSEFKAFFSLQASAAFFLANKQVDSKTGEQATNQAPPPPKEARNRKNKSAKHTPRHPSLDGPRKKPESAKGGSRQKNSSSKTWAVASTKPLFKIRRFPVRPFQPRRSPASSLQQVD